MDRHEEIIAIATRVASFIDSENAYCYEIGDGTVNYVYRVEDVEGHSVIVKHADTTRRNAEGLLLSTDRSAIEYAQFQALSEIVPNFIPRIYYYDRERHILVMEDLKEFEILREALLNFRTFPNFAAQVSRYLFDTLFKTTDLVVPAALKREQVRKLTNPEMCALTEKIVFTDPYEEQEEPVYSPENKALIESALYRNEALRTQVGLLKYRYKNVSQSMLHGEMNTTSVFINADTIKVFDPEYAFYGPMGFDVGTFIGSLLFPWLLGKLTDTEPARQFVEWLGDSIERIYERMQSEYENNYDALVTDAMARTAEFKELFYREVLGDSFGYAGTEIIRRTAGSLRTREFLGLRDPEKRARAERILIRMGTRLVMHRHVIPDGRAMMQLIRQLADMPDAFDA